MDGEGTFPQIFTYTSYSLAPQIFLLPVAVALSHVFTLEDTDFYYFIIGVSLAWTLALLVLGNMQTHYYTMRKNLLVLVIVAVVMALLLLVFMLIVAVGQQMFGFIRDIAIEIKYRV